MKNKGFKFNVSASQIGAANAGITPDQVDIIDLAFFDAIIEIANYQGTDKKIQRGEVFFKLSWQSIRRRLPYSGIKSRSGIKRRIGNLCDAHLLASHPDNQVSGESWYKMGEKYEIFINETPVHEKNTPSTKKTPRPPNDTPPVHNYGRLDNTLNDNSLSKVDKVSNRLKKFFSENSGQKNYAVELAKFRGNDLEFEIELDRWIISKAEDAAFLSNPEKYVHKFTLWLSRSKFVGKTKKADQRRRKSRDADLDDYQEHYGTNQTF